MAGSGEAAPDGAGRDPHYGAAGGCDFSTTNADAVTCLQSRNWMAAGIRRVNAGNSLVAGAPVVKSGHLKPFPD